MGEELAGSRGQFLARLQLFMDKTLRDLDRAMESKDSEEREVQAIRNVLLKIVRVWKEVVDGREEARAVGALVQGSTDGSVVDRMES